MPLREALTAELAAARRRRDGAVTAAMRATLAAVANAEAVPVDTDPGPGSGNGQGAAPVPSSPHFPGAVAGLGAAEVTRRTLTEAQVRAIVLRERDDLQSHAERLTRLCRRDEADGARRAAGILSRIMSGDSGSGEV